MSFQRLVPRGHLKAHWELGTESYVVDEGLQRHEIRGTHATVHRKECSAARFVSEGFWESGAFLFGFRV